MKADGKTPAKLPVKMSSPQNPAICFAGLWSRAAFNGEEIETCTIVTRSAIPPLDKLHDRMPVIVSPDDYRDSLNPEITDVGLFERETKADPPAKFEVLERGPGR